MDIGGPTAHPAPAEPAPAALDAFACGRGSRAGRAAIREPNRRRAPLSHRGGEKGEYHLGYRLFFGFYKTFPAYIVFAYTGDMTKSEFVDNLAKNLGFSKHESERVLDAVLETVRNALVNGEKIDLRGLGTFKVRESKSRQGRNPKTGETIEIRAKRSAAFKPGKELTVLLNGQMTSTQQVLEERPEGVLA
jgi:nucleoid DNA-binding protein